MKVWFISLLAAAGTSLAGLAHSQATSYPTQPIQIVVGFPPGGSGDTTARLIGQGLSRELGQSVVVLNKPGAGTNIAAQTVANAPADGYMLLLGGNGLVYSPELLYPAMKANLARDFAPIGGVINVPSLLLVRQDSNIQTLSQLIAEAKRSPGRINYGSTGAGIISHVSMEMLSARAGIRMTHIPYKGTAPMLTALAAGDVDVVFDVASSSYPLIQAGKLRALAVSGSRRLEMLPQVPTVAESGYPGFDVTGWYGLAAPRGTPAAIVQKLNGALVKVLSDPQTRETFAAGGSEVMPGSSADFQAFLDSERRKWTEAVKQLDVKVD